MVQDFLDLVRSFLLDLKLSTGLGEDVPQRHVQDGPALRGVDVIALEHGIPKLGHLGLFGQFQKGTPNLGGDEVLAVV